VACKPRAISHRRVARRGKLVSAIYRNYIDVRVTDSRNPAKSRWHAEAGSGWLVAFAQSEIVPLKRKLAEFDIGANRRAICRYPQGSRARARAGGQFHPTFFIPNVLNARGNVERASGIVRCDVYTQVISLAVSFAAKVGADCSRKSQSASRCDVFAALAKKRRIERWQTHYGPSDTSARARARAQRAEVTCSRVYIT